MPGAETRLCPDCGADIRTDDRFCRSCGGALSLEKQPSRYGLSPARVVVMSLLSLGLYVWYWLYLTWRQYRDHTGERAYPVWHSVAISVLVYGYFRAHAHTRCFKELMLGRGVPTTISPGWAVLAVIVISMLGIASSVLFFVEVTAGVAAALLLIDVVSVAVTVGLILHVQQNLNRYWDGMPGTPSRFQSSGHPAYQPQRALQRGGPVVPGRYGGHQKLCRSEGEQLL